MSATSDRSIRVLVLDDEPMILMDIEDCLTEAGFTPVTARTADRAMKAIGTAAPDVALLDVNLGHGETCEAVARYLHGQGVPFALHTGDLDRQGELVRQLDVPILPKPSSMDDIVKQVRRLSALPDAQDDTPEPVSG